MAEESLDSPFLEIRRGLNMPLTQMARMVGVTAESWRKHECGDIVDGLRMAKRVARKFSGVNPVDLGDTYAAWRRRTQPTPAPAEAVSYTPVAA
jgi:DNA-binding XRE family transcriptional regulator